MAAVPVILLAGAVVSGSASFVLGVFGRKRSSPTKAGATPAAGAELEAAPAAGPEAEAAEGAGEGGDEALSLAPGEAPLLAPHTADDAAEPLPDQVEAAMPEETRFESEEGGEVELDPTAAVPHETPEPGGADDAPARAHEPADDDGDDVGEAAAEGEGGNAAAPAEGAHRPHHPDVLVVAPATPSPPTSAANTPRRAALADEGIQTPRGSELAPPSRPALRPSLAACVPD